MQEPIMRKFLKLVAVLAFAATGQASHATVEFDLNTVINGSTPSGLAPWMTATFTSISGGVSVELDNKMDPGEFITNLAFNSLVNPTTLLFPGVLVLPMTSISASSGQVLNGDPSPKAGLFNIDIGLQTSNSGRFSGGTSVFFDIMGTGLSEDSFNMLSADGGPSNPGGWLMAAKVQGIPIPGSTDTTSGSIGFTNVSAVPEPKVYAMLGFGLALIGFFARRNRDSQHLATN